jgi:hypothetical protein
MRARYLLVALALAAGLSACSSSPSSGSSTTSTSAATTTTSPVTTTTSTAATGTTGSTTSTSTSVASTTTSSSATAAPCATSALAVNASTGQGAAGTQLQRFVVTNEGTSSCSLQGYPYIAPLGTVEQDGSPVEGAVPVKVEPIPSDFGDIGGAGGLVVLAVDGKAAFFLKWTDVQSGGSTCYKVIGYDFGASQSGGAGVDLVTVDLGNVCGGVLEDSQIFPPSVTS